MDRKILIVDDEKNIADIIAFNLKKEGYQVIKAGDGEEGVKMAMEENPDLILLDLMLPKMDGFEVCRRIRASSKQIGIIMLTARAQEMDKVSGLMLGADDYITKPFSPTELNARIDSLYRRIELVGNQPKEISEEIRHGDFVLNMRRRTLSKNERNIELTQVEFQIMEYFFSNPGVALDRTDILNHVWGDAYVGEDKIVDVNIRRLRMKVEDEPSNPKHIITVWGLGYKWDAND